MSHQYPQYPSVPPQPAPKKRKSHPALVAVTVGVLAWVAGCGTGMAMGSSGGDERPAAATSSKPQPAKSKDATHTTEPDPDPSPDGTVTGSCDYELGTELGDYALTGEVDVENTGNVGVIVKVKVKWPQYGTAPVKEVKKVRVPYGRSKTVRFNRDATSTEIDRLQTWKEKNDYADGCKIDGTAVDYFGQVHS